MILTAFWLNLALLHGARAQDGSQAQPVRAARSVHLVYPAPEAEVFYNEVTVDRSVDGSYFCVCGFRQGYFGIQQRTGGRSRVVLFSVWDPGDQNDPNGVDPAKRVKLISQGEGVRIGRFGGEGTGGQSFLDMDWQPGKTYRFLVAAKADGDRTTYSAWFHGDDSRKWRHIAAFSTLSGGKPLSGYYSFVEDFRRDGKSATEVRSARYGNGWVRTAAGDWIALSRARFTADRTTLTDNIDAGIKGGAFYLTTGGDTRETRPLNSSISRPPTGVELPAQLFP
jgi:hypothetical protein